jgi:poly(hydroxyalkanoate) granule-associated protein
MSEEVEVTVTEIKTEGERSGAMTDMVRRMMLAAMGVVAMSRDEMEQFVDRLIERGQLAEREGRQLIREVMEKRKRQAARVEEKVSSEVESRVEQLLGRLNIPTRRDIDELSARIAELTQRVEELHRVKKG